VIELSKESWLVAGIIPGVERQPLKKLPADEDQLLKLLERWRTEAESAGHKINALPLPLRRAATAFGWPAG
jgi:transposase